MTTAAQGMPDSLPPFVDAHTVASFCTDQDNFQSVEIKDTLKKTKYIFVEQLLDRVADVDEEEALIVLT